MNDRVIFRRSPQIGYLINNKKISVGREGRTPNRSIQQQEEEELVDVVSLSWSTGEGGGISK